MSDVARCRCPLDSQGVKCGSNSACPIHGYSGKDPIAPTLDLSTNDRAWLRRLRIADPDRDAEIQDVRQADEDRFNPPRGVP